jgi:protein ImuB
VPPWPGRLPSPSPTTVLARPVPIELWDSAGNPVRVTERYLLTSAPAVAAVDGARPVPVHGWGGPWPLEQRWWDATAGWRGSRLQVLLGGSAGIGGGVAVDTAADYAGAGDAEPAEAALLLFSRDGRWSVAGVYG